MALSQEAELVLQSYFSVAFIIELKNNNFLESDFYDKMHFGAPWIKNLISKISIDNQGMLLMCLYAMLVIPKELISNQFKNEYELINKYLLSIAKNTTTTYKTDKPIINYIRHIRNSVAHSKVEFVQNNYVVFNDKDAKNGNFFRTEIELKYVGVLLQKLQNINLLYY